MDTHIEPSAHAKNEICVNTQDRFLACRLHYIHDSPYLFFQVAFDSTLTIESAMGGNGRCGWVAKTNP